MLALCLVVVGHVPAYSGSCLDNCCKFSKHHDISQVLYLKGSGGAEVHIDSLTSPFDIAGNEILDVDVVFRDMIDQSTYELVVGCGGCHAAVDPVVVPPVTPTGYTPFVIEPFTISRYTSFFAKENRKYNTSGLDPSVCDQGHFTIRLRDFGNRTGSHAGPIVWGAVLGLGEQFTFEELLSFPIYVLRQHGDTWNDAGYTFWLSIFLFAPLFAVLTRAVLRRCGVSVLESMPLTMKIVDGKAVTYWRPENPRAGLYEIAVIAFLAVIIEGIIHIGIAAPGTSASDHGVWVALLVLFFANGLPLWQVFTSWAAMEYRKTEPDNDGCWARFRHSYWTYSASPLWWPIEFVTGFSFFLLFGAGFYLGPTMICLAALVRAGEVRNRKQPPSPRTRYKVTFMPVPPGEETAALLPGLYLKA